MVTVLYLCSVHFYGYCYCLYAVFVLDTGFHVFVWVGKDATPHEKGGGLVIAHVSSTGTVNLSEVNTPVTKYVCRSTVCTQYCRVLNFQHSCSITVNVHRLHVTFIVTMHGVVLTFITC